MRQFNVVVLGARGIGKAALTARFVCDVFETAYDPTAEYHRPILVDGERDALKVLDTSGAEQFPSLLEVYVKSAHGFVLVFRRLDARSQSQRSGEFSETDIPNKGHRKCVPIVVVGTKSDLVNEREVTTSIIESLASRWSLPFYETSAKRNWHVNDAFEDLTRQMRIRYSPDATKKANKKQPKGPCIIM
ncbi:hypothetical protein MSAN_00396900 [Mycena sanguinolenta]|uniref:Uncharacterized protein n=1 Tax=Mycena sanguinolenta TaxID=230812 RepID=A0A8H6Z9Q3_9AGAR|nr:hypothetical protein MSAN_00396900 [Mycena sanguinolenta]